MADFDRDSMLEMFTFEMNQLIEQLEQIIIQGDEGFSTDQINEIFRIMHTVKGSSAMMLFDSVAKTAHSMEDLFYYLREENPESVDYSTLADIILDGMDFIKEELLKIESGSEADGDGTNIINDVNTFLKNLKIQNNAEVVATQHTKSGNENVKTSSNSKFINKFKVHIFFEENTEMENVRCFSLLNNLKEDINVQTTEPDDISDENTSNIIKKSGFKFLFDTKLNHHDIVDVLNKVPYLKSFDIDKIETEETIGITNNANKPQKRFSIFLKFLEKSEMENVRSYSIINNMGDKIFNVKSNPENVLDENSSEIIVKNGFKFEFDTFMNYEEVEIFMKSVSNISEFSISDINTDDIAEETKDKEINVNKIDDVIKKPKEDNKNIPKKAPTQHVISVNVSKLDQLVNFMGELVIAEAMVTQNPELENLELDSFHKETRQLRKIINNLQDTVMSMRMVPLAPTFFKMNRIVRDMCKQLNKDVELEIIGEDTEVDKNIIEHIGDPLMHIIRNSIDHGIEMPDVRIANNKPEKGTVTLEAKNSGGDVLIIVKDDGAGLKTQNILNKAKKNNLLKKSEEDYTEKEIHQFIFLPGFSTNEAVTSYSGRGVGMDVVSTNLEVVGGTVIVESEQGSGSVFTLKIPLTLAIIEGMTILIGGEKYTLPISSIKQQFKCKKEEIFIDPDGNEMISIRGEFYNVIKLHEFFNLETEITNIEDGIMIMIEDADRTICVLADELIGEQQVVVKTLPKFINKIKGISGCTLIGNGDISLIIDVAGIFDK